MIPTMVLAAAIASSTPSSFVYVAAGVTSDERFDGMSRSNDRPSENLTLYYGRSDGLFAGVVTSETAYGAYQGPDAEIDLFDGKKWKIAGATITTEALGAIFLDQKGHQPNYNFFDVQAKVERRVAGIDWAASMSYSPAYTYGGGRAWDVRGTAALPVTNWLTFSGNVGDLTIQHSQDHAYGDIGATANWRRLSFDVRYVATNLDRAECFYTAWCAPALVASLTWRFLP